MITMEEATKLPLATLKFCALAVIILHCPYFCLCLSSFVLNEVPNLHVWITISSLANKDPSNSNNYLVRQVELNWINAPLEDPQDYVALYVDSEPDDESLPVFKHLVNNQAHGLIATGFYLPQIDFSQLYNNSNQDDQRYRLLQSTINSNQDDVFATNNGNGLSESQMAAESRSQLNNNQNKYNVFYYNNNNGQPATRVDRKLLLQDECLGYCLAYLSRDRIVARNCFKTNANWMSDIYQFIGSRSLPTIMLPGTHNSGTYQSVFDKSQLQLINKYKITQDESIFNQLIYGIRHIDLRVGYSDKIKGRHERFWIYHDIFRTDVSVDEVCQQVKQFLDMTTHEVIILDFHRFTVGFQNQDSATQKERHEQLASLIIGHLGHYIIPSYLGFHAPISEFVQDGKRLLIGYANKNSIFSTSNQLVTNGHKRTIPIGRRLATRITGGNSFDGAPENAFDSMQNYANTNFNSNSDPDPNSNQHQYSSAADGGTLFFPPVWHLWPNKDTLTGLSQFMNETTCRKYFGELRSMMAELTATVFGIITDKYNGNRQLAQLVNRPVTDWIRDRWWHCINIVSTDFFLGNDLVRLAIHANRLRITRHNTDPNHYRCSSFRRIQPAESVATTYDHSSNNNRDGNRSDSEINSAAAYAGHRWPDNQVPFSYNNNNNGPDSGVEDLSSEAVMIQTRSTNNHVYRPHDRRTIATQPQPTTNTNFVDDLTDGFSNLFVSFKRLFNL